MVKKNFVKFYHIFYDFFTKTEMAHFGDKIQSIDYPNIKVGIPKNYLNKGKSQAN